MECSTDQFERMAERAALQFIGGCLLNEGEPCQLIKKPYRERLQQARDQLEQELNGLDQATHNQVDQAINAYASTVEDVHFTLGMKIGARINAQLLGVTDRDYI